VFSFFFLFSWTRALNCRLFHKGNDAVQPCESFFLLSPFPDLSRLQSQRPHDRIRHYKNMQLKKPTGARERKAFPELRDLLRVCSSNFIAKDAYNNVISKSFSQGVRLHSKMPFVIRIRQTAKHHSKIMFPFKEFVIKIKLARKLFLSTRPLQQCQCSFHDIALNSLSTPQVIIVVLQKTIKKEALRNDLVIIFVGTRQPRQTRVPSCMWATVSVCIK
jgi:hypothetical protein